MSTLMITSVSWNPRGQAKALPVVADPQMEETAPEEEVVAPVAASNVSRATAEDDDIVAKYGLENYDEEPGAFRSD